MTQQTLARISGDRRSRPRRAESVAELVPTLQTFESWERAILKQMDRRRSLRREADVRRRVARL
jgi:hypothetical protein